MIAFWSKLINYINCNEDDGIEHLHDIPKNPPLKHGQWGYYEVPVQLQPSNGKDLMDQKSSKTS